MTGSRGLRLNPIRNGSRCGLFMLLFVSVALPSGAQAGPRDVRATTFTKRVIDPDFPAISAVAVDVDGDGQWDVVAGGGPSGAKSKWSNLIHWYRAPRWECHPVATLEPEAIILHLEAVDFSRPASEKGARPAPAEVVVTAHGKIRWYRYDRTSEQWTSTVVVAGADYAHGIAAGDIDRDGYTDLLVPLQPTVKRGEPSRRGILWARNPGQGGHPASLWETHSLTPAFSMGGWLHYVRLADLNGDGRLDALLGSTAKSGCFGYWLQGEDPNAAWEAHVLPGPMQRGTNLSAADLNGDGKPDLVGTEGHGCGVWWFPAPDFTPVRIDDSLVAAHCLALGDFNGDATLDIVSCGYESRNVALFLNRGDGTFVKQIIDTNQCAYEVQAVDMNQDGRLDILLSGQNSGNLVWYENGAQGSKATVTN